MKRRFTRIICIAAAAALSCGMLAGCGNDGAKTAITVNGEAIPYGEAAFMLRTNQAEVYYQMMSSGLYSSSSLWDEEYTADDEDEPGTYGSFFKDSITHELSELVLLKQKSGEYGVAIDETDIANTEALAQKFIDNNEEFVKNIGITYDQVLAVLQLAALRPKMKEAMTVDVDTNVSDEEADMTTITYLRLPYADETDKDAADKEADAAEAEAEDADDSGEAEKPKKTNEELYADCEQVLELFKTADNTDDYDALNKMADAVNEDFFGMTYSYAPTDDIFSKKVLDAVATLQDGEVYDGIIEDDDYYYMVKLDKLHDPEKIENKKQQIINERKTKMFEDMLHEWLDASDVSEEEIWTETTVTDSDRYLSKEFLTNDQLNW